MKLNDLLDVDDITQMFVKNAGVMVLYKQDWDDYLARLQDMVDIANAEPVKRC